MEIKKKAISYAARCDYCCSEIGFNLEDCTEVPDECFIICPVCNQKIMTHYRVGVTKSLSNNVRVTYETEATTD